MVPITIREMEQRSGLDRTNIRFYEREGLLEPARRANGYRDYSEDDLRLLLKIKLLRRLGFSLESIRALRKGETAMGEELERRLDALRTQRQEENAAEQVCTAMKADGAAFHTLDTQRYLRTYDRAAQAGEEACPPVPESDRVRSAGVPWRRFFARWLDMGILELLLCGGLALGFGVDLGELSRWAEWLLTFLVWALLIPLEALCVSRWGATPGKALMGISVGDEKERPLSFGRAAERTWEVFVYGAGCNIPIYTLYRGWKSYQEIRSGRGPEWDDRITVAAKPFRPWRLGAAAAAVLALVGAFLLLGMTAELPDNRGGDLTVMQFVENYNQLSARQNKGLNAQTLLPDGTLVRMNGRGELVADGDVRLVIEQQDGAVTALSYSRTDAVPSAYRPDGAGKQVMRIAFRAFAWADAGPIAALRSLPVLEELSGHREGTLDREVLGYRLTYIITPLGQAAGEGDTVEYRVLFRMSRVQ
ncbi:MAG: MerR family transcriptional regulator [Oscillospiraceae bacterium]